MGKLNGSLILLAANGTVIAAQKDVSLDVSRNLFPTTNKESDGWDEHGNGEKSVGVPFSSLQSTTGLSDKILFDFINTQASLLLVINGFTVPFVMEVDLQSMVINAAMESAVGLSGTFKPSGRIYRLASTSVQMITDPDAGGTDYDTLTVSGLAITSAIKSTAGAKKCDSNTISVVDTGVYKLFIYVSLIYSGQLPFVGIWDNTSAYISNQAQLVGGFNLVTLTATATDVSASLRFSNSANGNWFTSNIYLFKA